MALRIVLRFPWFTALNAMYAIFTAYLFITTAARANSYDCAHVPDYITWTVCVQNSAASSDERLNLIYGKVLSKLKGFPEAARLLVTAQRQWIAFRDTQCAFEGSTTGGNIRSTIVSRCVDRFAADRTKELFYRFACGEGNFACLNKGKLTTARGIPFESSDTIENYRVSGIWFPEELIHVHDELSGSAFFVFSDVKTGKTFTANVSGVALLPEDYLKSNGAAYTDNFEVGDLVERLKTLGVITIQFPAETRAKVVDCDMDKCLQLGTTVVDIQDVDFSGKLRFVFRQAEEGQRYLDKYKIMEISEESNHLDDKHIGLPLSELDGLSEINLSKKQIVLRESNGACAGSYLTYTVDPERGSGLKLAHTEQLSYDGSTDTCYIETYTANGVLISRQPTK